MTTAPMFRRESEYKLKNELRDANGQAHFSTTRLTRGQMDVIKLGRVGGYYPLLGQKKGKTKC